MSGFPGRRCLVFFSFQFLVCVSSFFFTLRPKNWGRRKTGKYPNVAEAVVCSLKQRT